MRDRKNDQIHRNVAAVKLGRPLAPAEVAHHVDEDKTNNAPTNLDVQTRGAHTAQHNRTRGLSKLRAALRMTADGKKRY
jgi:hypothetical protein